MQNSAADIVPNVIDIPWMCPSCEKELSSPFCPQCGESQPRELNFVRLFKQLFSTFTDVDGRLLETFHRLLFRPGFLTQAYVKGQRIPYIGPLQFFFLSNVLFFAAQSMTNTNIFSTTLESHVYLQDWSQTAEAMVSRRLANKRVTFDAYAPVFDRAASRNAKSLILLAIVPFSLVVQLIFCRRRAIPFFNHLVFALHIYAFLLLLFSVSSVLGALDAMMGGGGLSSDRVDLVLTLLNLLVCAVYLFISLGRVYFVTGLLRVLAVAILSTALAGIFLGYRFLIFLITLYTT